MAMQMYYDQVNTHKKMIYDLGKKMYPKFDYSEHDNSKFSDDERFAYCKMFFHQCITDHEWNTLEYKDKKNIVQELLSRDKPADEKAYVSQFRDAKCPKEEWEIALWHHYKCNKHHPQYWGDCNMPLEDLKESIVDMLACRHQYTAKQSYIPNVLNKHFFRPIENQYMARYTDHDKHLVAEEVNKFWLAELE